MLRSHHRIVLQVSLSSGMSGGSMNGGVCGSAWLDMYWGGGDVYGGP